MYNCNKKNNVIFIINDIYTKKLFLKVIKYVLKIRHHNFFHLILIMIQIEAFKILVS